jgi:sarcosine oxidase, subunit alpha
MVTVDGEGSVRSCVTEARPGQRVSREGSWPSVDHDALALVDRVHRLVPVGFYYKSLIRPEWAWQRVEPWVRQAAGRGSVDESRPPVTREVRHLHPDVAVVGAGVAGLSAALAAGDAGRSVVICDEGRVGEKLAPGRTRDRVQELLGRAASSPNITLLEQTPAVGIYEGPLVVLNEPRFLHLLHPQEVIVATGAVEMHGVFKGNDLPGVWLGRGAARLAGVHGISPGKRVVYLAKTRESEAHVDTLRATGADVTVVDGEIVEAKGAKHVSSVIVDRAGARVELPCDALVISLGLVARAGLALQARGLPVSSAGDAASPGIGLIEAEADGRQAGSRGRADSVPEPTLPPAPGPGIVCLCEDVDLEDLERAWDEGFRSTEILKRYTTATMGPCQGILCHCHLRSFVAARSGATGPGSGATTARPPTRPLTLEEAAAGVCDDIQLHQRTALDARHFELGVTMEPAAPWRRPRHYGDPAAEYWAVRHGVSVMDVGTLGKFLVGGPDATSFLEKLYPCNVADIAPGRIRYALLLGEHGFVVDDGVICSLAGGRWYVTFTSAGATTVEATLKDWAETWGDDVHIVDLTAGWGAINVAGPRSRELLQRLSADALDKDTFPYLHHREITVAGIGCRAVRVGFVGELSYELHHPSDRSVELWDALLDAGGDLDIRPHGLDALRLLRLEKGHIIVGQDTDFDATPGRLNMNWAVKLEKPWFVGKLGVQRANAHESLRRLVAVSFPGHAPPEGAPLRSRGRDVGYISSSGWSPVLSCGVSLGWVTRTNGSFPTDLEADGTMGTVVDHAFYDPKGERLRA